MLNICLRENGIRRRALTGWVLSRGTYAMNILQNYGGKKSISDLSKKFFFLFYLISPHQSCLIVR